ncbi:hypothetical protein C8R31_101359 [Nitrosospira sp. Nsp2]|uniref:hypothetical protein n=1 Tax=Nitrosospira sp. Nsp2 TaxID=136548 RepID=UPI000D30FCCB|nr:hypothetical protein [Nitrosospira sp. Nsp2]PTR17200.1 hypothetical protein C8R31_101359 [Nitrosospira sp. Nsp2]
MSLDDLLVTLERRDITPVTSVNPAGVTSKPAPTGALTPDTPVTRQKCHAEDVLRKAVQGAQGTPSQWWRFHYTHREPEEASYSPAATHAEAMAGEPDAIKAEPFEPLLREPNAPLSQEEEATILDWLERINETDEAIISAALHQCQTDQDARDFFIGLAEQ